MMKKVMAPEEVHAMYSEYYKGEQFIKVMPFGSEAEGNNFFSANAYSGRDDAQVYVTGNEDRMLVSARFDNLGKGASGAAVQCMNIVLGCEESKGLNVPRE